MSGEKEFTFEELKALNKKDNLHLVIQGKGESCFSPERALTLSERLRLTGFRSRLHQSMPSQSSSTRFALFILSSQQIRETHRNISLSTPLHPNNPISTTTNPSTPSPNDPIANPIRSDPIRTILAPGRRRSPLGRGRP